MDKFHAYMKIILTNSMTIYLKNKVFVSTNGRTDWLFPPAGWFVRLVKRLCHFMQLLIWRWVEDVIHGKSSAPYHVRAFKYKMIGHLKVGIVKEGVDIAKIHLSKDKHSIALNTTTPRKITLQLDLKEKSLKVWLNGHLKEKKLAAIVDEGPWYAFVELRG